MNRHINYALVKTAFRFNKPGHFKKWRVMNDKELLEAMLRQPQSKRKLEKIKEKGMLRDVVKYLHENLRRDQGSTLGTVYQGPGKRKGIGISRALLHGGDRTELRNVLAHEAWHANVPILGRSEILAHAYGKMKARGGSGVMHLIQSRPQRALMEAIPAATGLLGLGHIGSSYMSGVRETREP